MNTVKKGNLFEVKSLEIIKKVIENGDLGLISDLTKIQTKVKYPCRNRKGSVEFDLTIEVWPPNAKRYSMIYFIECKDYKTRIPIEKVKKFYADIIEVAGLNAKPIFIANSQFQEGAFDYAETMGMMLIQAESSNNYQIIFHKRNENIEKKIPLLKESINNLFLDIGVISVEKIIDQQIFNLLTVSANEVGYGIDKLSKEDIEEIANEELNKINPIYLVNANGLDAKIIETYLSQEYGIEIIFIKNYDFLGACDIQNKKIFIRKSLVGSSRYLFILCHEFGHFILHQKLQINQINYDNFSDSEYNFKADKHLLENPRQWIEWQANYFSISLLLPKTSVLAKLWQYQLRKGLPQSPLFFDEQYQNWKNFQEFVGKLSRHFEVSKTSIIYRFKELKYYQNKSKLKSVRELISEFRDEYFL